MGQFRARLFLVQDISRIRTAFGHSSPSLAEAFDGKSLLGSCGIRFCERKAAVVVAAGTAYGQHGEGYIRISLTVPDRRLEEVMERIRKVF